ncbi:MAG: ATP-binding protein [Thermoleophilaceae bacterium]|nr:ATP-binding protein [Thermoleophilaceae bacterium]
MIAREELLSLVQARLQIAPVVLLVGARQVGKTTLARSLLDAESPNYFDLERAADLARLAEPTLALESLEGLVVVDEVQLAPDLFSTLRVLVDRDESPVRFLLLGSASPEALRQASESLAGRIAIIDVGGFSISEVGLDAIDQLWLRGGFPRSFLAKTEKDSVQWRVDYLRTLTARDLPAFGIRQPAAMVERLLRILANSHGQIWKAAPAARSIGFSEQSTRKYVDLLGDAMITRSLPAWTANLGKRQMKSPKLLFRDSGFFHALADIDDPVSLQRSPALGASWEGFVIEEILKCAPGSGIRPYYWRSSNGAEVDLILPVRNKLFGVEIKRTDSPKFTRSMRTAAVDLDLDHVYIVNAGKHSFPLADNATATSIKDLVDTFGLLLN